MSSAPIDGTAEAPGLSLEDGIHKPDLHILTKEELQRTTAGSTTTEKVEDVAVDTSMPLNWPTSKKVFNMAIPSILCFVV